MQSQQHFRRHAALFSLLASLTLGSAWASQDNNLPNFKQVSDHVYRGGQPTDSGFQRLAQLGIKTVIDLRDIGEHSQAHEQKTVTDLGMRYVNIPMHGMSTPKDDQVEAALALLNDTASGPVFVHCKRGADRTGGVIAMYRVSHDEWDNKKALQEAKSNGMSFFASGIRHYVMDYRPATTLAGASAGAAPVSALVDAPAAP
jgi:tyrosine-protein phosphatase SIW14